MMMGSAREQGVEGDGGVMAIAALRAGAAQRPALPLQTLLMLLLLLRDPPAHSSHSRLLHLHLIRAAVFQLEVSE
jgi:hypothetical protein